ncbi:uncharacterized protein N7506_004509 [Penicillium brevicompactum]|uniref:uncharacterized protein n=1 Tax=Penicillium brevicompactum TaxID=5074 RepID=UPI00253FCE93|nr:uncharacterized protein N7506_004509 [Penicillium brevicompactum]KAJ5336487.1 hypothetical protein N7506_004509 [Penicillium brevicompactum]
MQIRPLSVLGLVLPLLSAVQANVEKTIFLAPAPATIPSQEPSLDDLGVERLSPQNPVVRTRLNASFPTTAVPEGTESWFFLEKLNPGQRYEVRVCWLSTQPTSFTLTTYPLSKTIEDTSLLSSLSIYTSARLASLASQPQASTPKVRKSLDTAPTSDSVLFLRVHAAADYFSTNQTLMRDVPPVAVDLILDPFLFNVFPRSLVPTAGWIIAVAVLAAVLGRWIVGEVGRVIDDARRQRSLEEMKNK